MNDHGKPGWAICLLLLLPLWVLVLSGNVGCSESEPDAYKPLNASGHPVNYVEPVHEKSGRQAKPPKTGKSK